MIKRTLTIDQVIDLLQQQKSADDIANLIKNLGLKGKSGCVKYCIIAKLFAHFGCDVRVCYETVMSWNGKNYSLPRSVTSFIWRFDTPGFYEDLKEK